jgi:hypothetical protein
VLSGFLPPEAPLRRLGGEYEAWEELLDAAQRLPLMQGAGGAAVDATQRRAARAWRRSIREVSRAGPL